ncbi:MAG: hypothetical protein CVV21_04930 [Candidatus Goldiibacteriota bacterium HGW-Goldbacteria-1]|nr:MAG: hypothetical protein CVV21_04930 [Candidatus Goldiibacteriota bacterium HGW-Goldbacteria-1]
MDSEYYINRGIKKVDKKTMNTLFTIGIIFLVLWALGLVTSYTLGGAIHILFVLAVILIIVWLLKGGKKL